MASMDEINRYAEEASRQTGVPASVIAAQAALESRYGKSAPGNNYFGIKAGGSWKGPTQRLMTTEFVKGKKVRVKQNFRKYGSMLESFTDWGNLIASKPRYAGVMAATTPDAAMRALAASGYATDPKYYSKLRSAYSRVTGGTAFAASPTPPADVSTMGSTTLKQGSKGERVEALQHVLSRAGFYQGKIDGDYGPATKAAVKAFQQSQNKINAAAGLPALKEDGVVGNNTRPFLVSWGKQQAGPEAVAQADLALGQAAEPPGAPKGDLAGQRRMEDQAVLNAKLGASMGPLSGVSTRPLPQGTPTPFDMAQRIPDAPVRPLGAPTAPQVPDRAVGPLGVPRGNLAMTAPQPGIGGPTPEQFEAARQQIRDVQGPVQLNPHDIGVDPRNLPVEAGTGGGVFNPAAQANARLAEQQRQTAVQNLRGGLLAGSLAPPARAPGMAQYGMSPSGRGNLMPPNVARDAAQNYLNGVAERRIPMPRGGSVPLGLGAGAKPMSDTPRSVPNTRVPASQAPMLAQNTRPRSPYVAPRAAPSLPALPSREVGYAPGAAPLSQAAAFNIRDQEDFAGLNAYQPTNPMAASASLVPTPRMSPLPPATPAQLAPQGIMTPIMRGALGLATGGPLGGVLGLGASALRGLFRNDGQAFGTYTGGAFGPMEAAARSGLSNASTSSRPPSGNYSGMTTGTNKRGQTESSYTDSRGRTHKTTRIGNRDFYSRG